MRRLGRLGAAIGAYNRQALESMAPRDELIAQLTSDAPGGTAHRFRVEGGAGGNSALVTRSQAYALARRTGGKVVELAKTKADRDAAAAKERRMVRLATGCVVCGGKVHVSPITHRAPLYCTDACAKRAAAERRKAKRAATTTGATP